MSLRREQLLGYLLGALELEEREQVQRELGTNARLREELAEIQAALEKLGLNDPPEPIEPPADLVQRTCQLVASTGEQPSVALPPERAAGGASTSYTLTDAVVAASVMLVLAALLFPSLARSRFLARLTTCQNNLRQVGIALWHDSELSPNRTYARLSWEDERTVAGMMASTLLERQLIDSPDVFICPASDHAALLPGFPMPTVRQMRQATGPELERLKRLVGGSFAYPIGFSSDGQVVPPRNTYRETYCLVGEAPVCEVGKPYRASHEGAGGNFFFEDGHIRWIEDTGSWLLVDDPYRNRHWETAPGLDRDDSVLGGGSMRPQAPIVPVVHQPQ
jgi:hypothetical protein